MGRVIAYIDGFNLYHAIDNLHKPWLKWVDLYSLCGGLLRDGETLIAVKYFSAFATWMPERYVRHRAYVDALVSTGVTTCMSQFKEKPRSCFKCKAQWIGHEEKETDVQIAVTMVADALTNNVDRLIVISADTDLTPAIRTISRLAPKCQVLVAAPPKRLGICRALNPKFEISGGRIARHLLPAKIERDDGTEIVRPRSYDPPVD